MTSIQTGKLPFPSWKWQGINQQEFNSSSTIMSDILYLIIFSYFKEEHLENKTYFYHILHQFGSKQQFVLSANKNFQRHNVRQSAVKYLLLFQLSMNLIKKTIRVQISRLVFFNGLVKIKLKKTGVKNPTNKTFFGMHF